MKVEFKKYSIRIIPQSEADEVYLEAVLGLEKKGERATVERVAAMELDRAWAYAEVRAIGRQRDDYIKVKAAT